jgi:hypothetical protein
MLRHTASPDGMKKRGRPPLTDREAKQGGSVIRRAYRVGCP